MGIYRIRKTTMFNVPLTIVIFIAAVLSSFALVSCSPVEPQGNQDQNSNEAKGAFSGSQISDLQLETETYDVKLGFIGDLCLADNYIPMQHLAQMGTGDISQGIDQRFIDQMKSEDVMWANNEFAYSDRGEPLAGKAWTFCSKTSNVSYLDDLGIDIVGLANNHVFDFGADAFEDTLTTLQAAGMPYVGAGWDEGQAYAPVYMEVGGIRIAYVAASRAEYTVYTLEAEPEKPGIAWCYENAKFIEAIRQADANADFVVALPHWGTEHSTALEAAQTDSARAYIDAGADCVIGAHPHILQGIEFYDGKPIIYSLGNFWFDDCDIDTVLAEIEISGERVAGDGGLGSGADVSLRFYPGIQSGVFTKWLAGEIDGKRVLDEIVGISPQGIDILPDGIVVPLDE